MAAVEALLQRAREERRDGKLAAAESTYGEAALLAATHNELQLKAHALRHIAELAAERGAGDGALDAAQEAMEIYKLDPTTSPLDLANARRVRALAYSALGRAQDSAEDWRAARDAYQQLGIAAGVAECDRRLNPN